VVQNFGDLGISYVIFEVFVERHFINSLELRSFRRLVLFLLILLLIVSLILLLIISLVLLLFVVLLLRHDWLLNWLCLLFWDRHAPG